VISFAVLREVGSGPEPFQIDLQGVVTNLDDLPDRALVPALVVGQVTDAVKQAESGMVAGYLDRDTVWAVNGFVLDRDIVAGLDERVDSAVKLLEAVREAGFEWHAVVSTPTGPDI
jgi:hypothetical protein